METDPQETPDMQSLLPKGGFTRLLLLLLGMLAAAALIETLLHLLLEDVILTAVFIYATCSFGWSKRLHSLVVQGAWLPGMHVTMKSE